jgi:hypothetical protein
MAAVVAQLVDRGTAGFQLRLNPANCWRNALGLQRQAFAQAPELRRALPPSPVCRLASSALSAMRCSRSASAETRCWSIAKHAALQVGMKPVDALERSFRAAPALFKAGQFGGYLRRFLLQAFAFLPRRAQLRLQRIEGSLGLLVLRFQARRFFALLVDRCAWLRARPCSARLATSTPANGAPRAAPPIPSASGRALVGRFGLRLAPLGAAHFNRAASSSIARVSAAASSSACATPVSSTTSLPSASRSSRFKASGPSLAGLPPVTVALWKHSPPGVRKKPSGCCKASRCASAGSSTR